MVVAGLMVSRLPTLSFKTMRVPSRLVAPLLVLVGLAAAVLVDGAVPRAGHRRAGLPGDDPVHDAPPPLARRAPGGVERAGAGAAGVVRSARSARRLGLRSPLRRRVAGRASAMARAVRRFGEDGAGRTNGQGGGGPGPAQPRNRLRLGLRRARRR